MCTMTLILNIRLSKGYGTQFGCKNICAKIDGNSIHRGLNYRKLVKLGQKDFGTSQNLANISKSYIWTTSSVNNPKMS